MLGKPNAGRVKLGRVKLTGPAPTPPSPLNLAQRPTIDEIMRMPEVRSKVQYLPLELQRLADEQQVRLVFRSREGRRGGTCLLLPLGLQCVVDVQQECPEEECGWGRALSGFACARCRCTVVCCRTPLRSSPHTTAACPSPLMQRPDEPIKLEQALGQVGDRPMWRQWERLEAKLLLQAAVANSPVVWGGLAV